MKKIGHGNYERNLIDSVNNHNNRCEKVMKMIADGIGNQDCVETMRMANLETGIEYCCWMREVGFAAVVDAISGMVLPESEVDMNEQFDGKNRYNSFEWADTEEA